MVSLWSSYKTRFVKSVLSNQILTCLGTHGSHVSAALQPIHLCLPKKSKMQVLFIFWVDVITIYINKRFLKFRLIW